MQLVREIRCEANRIGQLLDSGDELLFLLSGIAL